MQLPPLIPATFVLRDNRFRATVCIGGEHQPARVASSGRMQELLVPGRRVWVAAAHSEGRKTAYDLLLAEHRDSLVSVDAHLPNRLWAEHLLATGWQGRSVELVKPEQRRGSSRLDFYVESAGVATWMEVKSVTLVEERRALFPDAPTVRGARHVHELAEAVAQGERAAVIFVVQREDALTFAPHTHSDPAFAEALSAARRYGVQVHAYACRVSLAEVAIDHEIPVQLD